MSRLPASVAIATLLTLTIGSIAFAAQVKELIGDPQFQRGFEVHSPNRETPKLTTKLGGVDGKSPIWHLAQWHSKFSIASAEPHWFPLGGVRYENESKSITVTPDGSLTLGVDTRAEYPDGCRVPNHKWPHLLVQQSPQVSDRIGQMQSLRLCLEVRVPYDRRFEEVKNYNPALHTAHTPLVMIIQNRNRKSPGFGDFLWFTFPVYDSRHRETLPPHIAVDRADPSSKLIYNPGSAAYGYGDENLHDRQWHTFDLDLLPFIHDAFEAAWEKGYLQGSRDLDDYQVSSVIFGWEVTGVNRAAIEFKNLSLKAAVKSD